MITVSVCYKQYATCDSVRLWYIEYGVPHATSNASSALTSYNERLVTDINQIKEKFVIAHVSFNYPQQDTVTVWLYNSGTVPIEITGVLFGTDETLLSSVTFSPSPLIIPKGELVTLSFTSSTTSGTTYYVKVVTKLGNTAITFQKG